jgi:hypothetical protein
MTCPHIKSGSYCKICDTKPEKKKPKSIRKVSVKRVKENKEYSHRRKLYLELNPVCEVHNCGNKSTEIHHKKGRIGELLIDIEHFLAVCEQCHKYIELNPVWAKIQGYSETRL